MDLSAYSGNVGIMAHANTSGHFLDLVKEYPLEDGCCPYHGGAKHAQPCAEVQRVRARTVKMCDSGVFTKQGASLTYPELFAAYQRAGVEYGIMIDFLRDRKRTVAGAREAMAEYKKQKRTFKLVAVAQGRNPDDYLLCYRQLRDLGFKHIAVGGLLNRRKNTARYVYVRGGRLFRILEKLRQAYPRDWMFALGCYHPRRHEDMQRFGLFGADYKGWIFNYEAKNHLGTESARSSRFQQVQEFMRDYVYADTRQQLEYRARKPRPNTTLAVVACSKKKIWSGDHVGSATASNTYQGAFFRMASRIAADDADRWVILSAKHGFLNPGTRIKRDYDETLPARLQYAQIERLRGQIIAKGLHEYAEIVVLGGSRYQAAVEAAFSPFGSRVRAGLPPDSKIGTRLQLLKRANRLGDLQGTIAASA